MNHFLLPSRISNSNNPNDITLAGDAAMETMLNAMLSKGAKKCRLLAKMFGGGTIVSKTSLNIGQRNVVFAREWIGREGIKLAAIDVLGNCSRKLLIDPISGDVFCCRSVVDRSAEEKLAATEAAYEKRLIGLTAKNNIELF
ncbi:MAG: chemotaxis protein CheD [uncultured bacterium]|nr:MAG: chemotaxis protein CheD [uncultured bacterium]